MSRGVVILALGKPQYGEFAYNLARSIRAGSKLPIALVWGQNALKTLNRFQKTAFDSLIECPKNVSHFRGTLMPCRAKLMLMDLSPFDETLFIDADSLVLPGQDVNDVLNTYPVDCDLVTFCPAAYAPDPTATNRVLWSTMNSILAAFPEIENPVYQIHSFWLFWRNTDRVREFFAKALDIYERLSAGTIKLGFQSWHGQVPDELPLAIATGILGVCPLPTQGIFHRPIADACCEHTHKEIELWADKVADIEANYCSFTMPGCSLHSFWINLYNKIVNDLHSKSPVGSKFLWASKNLRF